MVNIQQADHWIKTLGLVPLPEEGGLYKENYRSDMVFDKQNLPERYDSSRTAITDIYYLLQGEMFSAFHRLKSDEIWHYHTGSQMLVHIIDDKGNYCLETLGLNQDQGETLRITFPRGYWFAAEMKDKSQESYALVSCVVAPGFEFSDFELGKKEDLIKEFPQHEKIIQELTRE
ncbi:MAG: cupin domain-containing protein [bacterium]|nr:cupin domain-containing protein [bacterium]MBU1919165.1 cupin domain-containing protein [bacterium]